MRNEISAEGSAAMKNDPDAGAPGQAGNGVILRLLAAGRDARTNVASQSSASHDAERLDAAAGCEFVDDRIRCGNERD
jgi:hypothetical protein